MGFNQTYSAIEKLWKEKFENQIPERERSYVSSRMNKLKILYF